MLPRPLSVVANEDYTLSITFNNGEKRLFNMTPYLIYPAFEALKAINLFMRACKNIMRSYGLKTLIWRQKTYI